MAVAVKAELHLHQAGRARREGARCTGLTVREGQAPVSVQDGMTKPPKPGGSELG